jgi:hypothetical protein
MADEPDHHAAEVFARRLAGLLIDVGAACCRSDRILGEAGLQLDTAGGTDRLRLRAALERHFIARIAINRTLLERVRELK